MERLELKHLAPYLPYGLDILDIEENEILRMISCNKDELHTRHYEVYYEHAKPILRPLSDLTKEIEHNGERFVPIGVLSKFTSLEIDLIDQIYEADRDGEMKVVENVTYLSYHQVNNMFEWHFDVFGLIDKGLAINLNEI